MQKKYLKYEYRPDGYLSVNLWRNNKSKHKLVHRLVAETYILNINNYMIVNHIDGNKNNNNVNNLEWCSHSYNSKHYHSFLKSNIKGKRDGKASQGGLRIGEMERDVLCSHGVALFINEKFFEHSDEYDWHVCRCGRDATIVNLEHNIFICKYCKDNADICTIKTSWSSKLFFRELASINVGVIKSVKPFEYELFE